MSSESQNFTMKKNNMRKKKSSKMKKWKNKNDQIHPSIHFKLFSVVNDIEIEHAVTEKLKMKKAQKRKGKAKKML